MSENKDYISRLNKARRNRNQKWDPRYILMALAAVVLIGIIVLAVINVSQQYQVGLPVAAVKT